MQRQGRAILFRQPSWLLVEDGTDLRCDRVIRSRDGLADRRLSLAGAPTRSAFPRLQRDTIGDAVEPASQRCRPLDRRSLASEDEEGGLERVLRVMRVPEHATADAQDQTAMTLDQGLE